MSEVTRMSFRIPQPVVSFLSERMTPEAIGRLAGQELNVRYGEGDRERRAKVEKVGPDADGNLIVTLAVHEGLPQVSGWPREDGVFTAQWLTGQ